ncbi:MAG: DUF1553 domain-containing protein [Verrucomicrobiales bacterium]|nr:DUF1553 domain-containing protein [Verrucomicrobiales bacterium]
MKRMTRLSVRVPAWLACGFLWLSLVLGCRGATASSTHEHWSLQPVREPLVPEVPAHALRGGNAVDAFLEGARRQKGLVASPEADRRTLIRRLYLDLIGLPPSPGEVEAFVRETSPRAYEDCVERLLASPHYGERWARHWLDTVRYTESQGFEYDRLRDRAWPYRDYVIASFNEDRPYDRFMMEQVAGDVMEPVTREGIVATSLLVCGPWDEAGSNQANLTQRATTREEELEDMVGVVGQTFLGLTVNCARCHAHKFDPIPQEDYFRLKSVFEGVRHGERAIEGAAEVRARAATVSALQRQREEAEAELAALDAEVMRRAPEATVGPRPRWVWSFTEGTPSPGVGQLRGGARVEHGALVLAQDGAWFESTPLEAALGEKTLEAWVSLSDLEQGGGAAISVETLDGRVFDALVFGERQPRRWTAGSEGFVRTRDLGEPEERVTTPEWIHLVAVYGADGMLALYRNGVAYGKPYRPDSSLRVHPAGSVRVVLGMRHTGGSRPWLRGRIRAAAVHDRALAPEEVAQAFRSRGGGRSMAEWAALLSAPEQARRQQAIARIETARHGLAALPPAPMSYVGTRVQPAPTRRLLRGDVTKPAEVVVPAGLSALAGLESDLGLAADAPEGERRLRFARWLADARNPLPARVMVNRIWQQHFGVGLVSTPNDLGLSGARPTHPELLDWLAIQFVRSGWSVKAVHRWIVNSAAYRQSSASRREALAVDADNQWLWRYAPRRLEAEALRDSMLAASGQLNPAMGGASVRPFEILTFPANAYLPVDKEGPEFNRRAVYRMNVNSGKEPMLDAFDCPDPAVKTPRRGVTTTPLQALALMNGSFVQRQAGHLATRATRAYPQDARAAIQWAFQWTLGRPATEEELTRSAEAAQARGLQSVCWALLNSTEFVYVQ